jgi:hypothetical protein
MATKTRKRHKEKQFRIVVAVFCVILRVQRLFSFGGAAQVQKPAHSAGSTFTNKAQKSARNAKDTNSLAALRLERSGREKKSAPIRAHPRFKKEAQRKN